MEDLFVTYNQAIALKELGFNEKCFAAYRDSEWIGHDGPNSRYFHAQLFSNSMFDDDQPEYCSSPLKSQVFKWFRDKHGLYSSYGTTNDFDEKINGYVISVFNDGVRKKLHINWEVGTYEEAESECIDRLISIIKEKK
jgi:hypothetical protein